MRVVDVQGTFTSTVVAIGRPPVDDRIDLLEAGLEQLDERSS